MKYKRRSSDVIMLLERRFISYDKNVCSFGLVSSYCK